MGHNDSYVNLQAEKRFELLRRKKSMKLETSYCYNDFIYKFFFFPIV